MGIRKWPSALLRAPPRSPLMEILALVIAVWVAESRTNPWRVTSWALPRHAIAMIKKNKIQAFELVPNFIIYYLFKNKSFLQRVIVANCHHHGCYHLGKHIFDRCKVRK